jgi:hypothetical protein
MRAGFVFTFRAIRLTHSRSPIQVAMSSHVACPRCLAACAVLILAACGREAKSREGQVDGSPVLARVVSVRLAEDDSAPLGAYLFPAKRADGMLYLGDMTNARVVQFDGRGRLVRVIGRKGNGPGELQSPACPGALHFIAARAGRGRANGPGDRGVAADRTGIAPA